MSLDQELDIKEHPFAAATLFLSNKQCVPPAQLQMFLEPLHSEHLNCYFCNPKLSQNIYMAFSYTLATTTLNVHIQR
jgi:hypothetical protein